MLLVVSDMPMAADGCEVALLGMLDLSTALDRMGHTILLERLRIGFGVTDVALHWITSFLTERTEQMPTTVSCPAYSLCCLAYHSLHGNS